jgi:hypothetical protein
MPGFQSFVFIEMEDSAGVELQAYGVGNTHVRIPML